MDSTMIEYAKQRTLLIQAIIKSEQGYKSYNDKNTALGAYKEQIHIIDTAIKDYMLMCNK